jgi:DNA polymerase III delta prime subunit
MSNQIETVSNRVETVPNEVETSPLQNTQTFISLYKPYYIEDFSFDHRFKAVLRTLINIDNLNILVVGPSSSGKTSLLYAILRDYYGLEKNQPFPENNILFINTLKEQGINYYRNEMKTFCQSRCSIYGLKKIIIIDDIDMINEQCQQVFRNYIDKYKNNVHFVFAASNLQKVIESIQSRIHIIQIQAATSEQIHQSMQNILLDKKLTVTEEAQDYLVTISNHSMREMINHIEKIFILSNRPDNETPQIVFDTATCQTLCSNISIQQFELYIRHLVAGEITKAIAILYHIYDYGYSIIDIFDYFYSFIKHTTLMNEDQKYKVLPYLCKYITIFHSIHEDCIELALFTNNISNIFIQS